MAYRSMALSWLPLLALACAAPVDRDPGPSGESALEGADGDASATLRFGADWSVQTTGAITSGRKVRVEYDANRMPSCRGDMRGGPGWAVTGYYRVAGGAIKTFNAAGHSPTGAPDNVLDLPAAMGDADLEVWFENTSVWGCQAWDSNQGSNYHFVAKAPPEAPAWMGDVRYASTRSVCDHGRACDGERKPLGGGTFTFDDWSRERAASNMLSFRVYKPGVTDYDNGNVWRDLDVRVYTRARSRDEFHSTPVDTEKRIGNDEGYAFDVRSLDPFKAPSNSNHRVCPDVDAQRSSDGATVSATIELYFTVNGVELRPAPGESFRGVFTDAASPWAGCSF
jgi:hypothetical protein